MPATPRPSRMLTSAPRPASNRLSPRQTRPTRPQPPRTPRRRRRALPHNRHRGTLTSSTPLSAGIDQYHQITDLQVSFRNGSTVLNDDSKQKLDELAAGLTGREGYILEMDAHCPGAGSTGISSSERLNEAVERYLVEQHQIPIYRLHAVALGNAQASTSGDQDQKPERGRTSTVHIRLMENSLAAQASAPPQNAGGSSKGGTAVVY